MDAFTKLIDGMPRALKVLEIGYAGLGGENTTDALRRQFHHVDGLCKDGEAVKKYLDLKESTDIVIVGRYPEDMDKLPHPQYDLVVFDPNIEANLEFWGGDQKFLRSFLEPGGKIITYLMTDETYGDELTRKALRKFWNDRSWEWMIDIFHKPHFQEERRAYITWIML